MRVEWNFGDGEFSNEVNPVHVYRMPGEYTVTVTVYNDYTTGGMTYGNCIYGSGPYKGYAAVVPAAIDFVGVPVLGRASLSVAFTLLAVVAGTLTKVKYVRVFDWSVDGGIDVSVTDTCLRYAAQQRPAQGVGWAIYDDLVQSVSTGGWPYPEGNVGSAELITANEERIQAVIDAKTYRLYRLGAPDEWVDGRGEYAAGTEFESEVIWPEATPQTRASARLRMDEAHVFVKPWYKDRRNETVVNQL